MWDFLFFILIGAVAGWLAGVIFKGKGFGFWLNLFVGIVGGSFGGWLFGKLGINSFGFVGSLVAAVIGAIILLWLLSLIRKK